MSSTAALVLAFSAMHSAAEAEIVSMTDDAFTLSQSAASPLKPEALWARLIDPAQWWSDAHTYTGDAGNLSFSAEGGACWCEEWDGGSVAHGRVLTALPPNRLVIDAPFGPLQALPATAIWTVTIASEGQGSLVRFEQRAGGSTGLGELAGPVDAVMTEAISRLVAGE